jgi:hypothetical protein
MSKKIKETLEQMEDMFRVGDLIEMLPDMTTEAVRVGVKRLCDDKVIAPVSRGVYRKITQPVPIDYTSATEEYVPLELPLGLGKLVQVTPASVIIVAGVPNAGKSAFLLNVLRYNMLKYEMDYFSSELNDTRFKIRLNCFEDVEETYIEWKFDAYELNSDYKFFVHPDRITIIDYLEVYDEFYKVSKYINDVFRVLKKGVALIAIQKNAATQYGIGGTRSSEKAHLYLTLDNNILTIVKAKDWKTHTVNPNNMAIEFKLVQGSRFIPVGDWYRVGTKIKKPDKPYQEVF